MARHVCEEALSMIKSFEGLRLAAYPDPGTGGDPWTVGYGHTGPEVIPGYRITEQEAHDLLRADVRRFEECVEANIPGLTHHQFCALTSFAFNVGCGALAESTLRRRILRGEDPSVVIPKELPRWINGGNGPMEGLKRCRAAEVAHAALEDSESVSKAPEAPLMTPPPPHKSLLRPLRSTLLISSFITAAASIKPRLLSFLLMLSRAHQFFSTTTPGCRDIAAMLSRDRS